MPEAQLYNFTHREMTELMIRKLDIHEGMWVISFAYSTAGFNLQKPGDGVLVTPAICAFIDRIGISRCEDMANLLAVDAAEVNPKPMSDGERPRPVGQRGKANA